MSANDSLERRIADYYETEAPPRAPDWVLRSTLDTIDDTRQRRVVFRAPWRFPHMNSFAKVAVAAVVVIAVGAVGLSVLGTRSPSGVGGQPSASPSPSLSPSLSPSTEPSAPPPLSSTFTSTMHGFSIAYPTGWLTAPATEPMKAPGLSFTTPDMDWIYDGRYNSDLFLAMGSQPLAGKAPDTWVSDFLSTFDDGCGAQRIPITVDGTNGVICGGSLFVTAVGGRGYFVRSYTGSDLTPADEAAYDETWFRSVLATLQLHPENAVEVDTLASPSASP
jgi:hypothetical protein